MTVALNKQVPNFSAPATGGDFDLSALARSLLLPERQHPGLHH